MNYNDLFGRFWLVAMSIFIITAGSPAQALAFEAQVVNVTVTSRVVFVRTTIKPYTPSPTVTPPASQAKAAPTRQQVVRLAGEPVLVLEGTASYYSRAGCLGCNPLRIMANGQPLNDHALTMAIGADQVHLVGRSARVTSLATGKSVQVRITDTGGFYQAKYGHRVADLTPATKNAIGMKGGLGPVRVEVF